LVPATHAVTVEVAELGQKLPAGHWVHEMLAVAVQTDETYWPVEQVLHAVHVAALVVVEYVLPAVHAVHWMSEEAVQAALTRAPAEHTEHVAQLVALELDAKFVPAVHGVHVVSIVALHHPVVKVPAAHTVHVCGAAAPPAQNEPAGHAAYALPFQNWPRGAAVPPVLVRGQEELPATDVVPAAHAVHALEPASAAKVPAAQGVQLVELPRPKVPAAHAVHPALVALGTQYVPAQQHTVEPDVEHWGKVTPEVQPVEEQVETAPVYSDHSSIET
jgi:hypothetical protein